MMKRSTTLFIPVKLTIFFLLVILNLKMPAQGIIIGSGTTFSLGSASLSIPGDWINNGSFSPGSGTVIFDGTDGDQTITNTQGGIFNNIIVDKLSGELQLQNNIIINGTLEFAAGGLNLNGDTITLGTNAFVNETPGNTVQGSGIITGAKLIDAPSAENIFGLGAVITSSSNFGLTVIKRGHTAQTGNGNQSILRYYDITPANNSGLNATVVFSYDNSELNGLNESNLKLYHSTDNGTTWIQDAGILDTANNTVTLNNINSFSRWTLGESLVGSPIVSHIILLNAAQGALSGDARLGSMTGMKNTRAVYFQGTSGGVTFNVNIPSTGTWYAWARMYYISSGGKNSFFINLTSSQFVLGDNDTSYNKWYWDGFNGSKVTLGTLQAGLNNVKISGREPGLTLWVDQVVLTNDPNFIPTDSNVTPPPPATILLSASQGIYSGDARLGSMTGMKGSRAAYFQGPAGGVSFNVDLPSAGRWYAWARMYYMSSGGKNSFFINAKNLTQVLGDDDTKYNQWHWDGHAGSRIILDSLPAGINTIKISGREPGLTLWVDQLVLSNDSNYVPQDSVLFPPSLLTVLLNAKDGKFSGDARLGSMSGMKNSRAVYFQGTTGGITFDVNIPATGNWYVWARMYYMSAGGKNSFLLTSKGTEYILGDDDTKYNQWHWDGYLGSMINLGPLNAGINTIKISGREPGLTLWVDQIVLANNPTYNPNTALGKESADGGAEEIEETLNIPKDYSLSQNFPNPFNPVTEIKFSLPEDGNVSLKIYNITGQLIKTLVDDNYKAGHFSVPWNGTDNFGSQVSSGIYFYRISASGTRQFTVTKKMVFLK